MLELILGIILALIALLAMSLLGLVVFLGLAIVIRDFVEQVMQKIRKTRSIARQMFISEVKIDVPDV